MIFSKLVRNDHRAKRRDESYFAYLDFSARPEAQIIRDFCETHINRYPEKYRSDLISRFKDNAESQHYAAFFELFLFSLFSSAPWSIVVHPDLPNNKETHPDFLVSFQQKPCFYLEATIATKSVKETASEMRVNQVLETVNRIESPDFFLDVSYWGDCKTPPPGAKWRNEISKWLGSLSHEKISEIIKKNGLQGLPSKVFSHQGFYLKVSPLSKSPELRGRAGINPIGVEMGGMQDVKTHKAIRSSAMEKGKKYGKLDLPLVLAINAIDDTARKEYFFDALFGDEENIYTIHENGIYKHKVFRKPNGALLGPCGPANTSISSVMAFLFLHPWRMNECSPLIIINPWAKIKSPKNLCSFQHFYPKPLEGLIEAIPGNESENNE